MRTRSAAPATSATIFAGHPVPPKTLSPDADYPVINIEKGGLHADASAEWAEEDVLPRIGWIDAGIKFNVVPAKAKALVLGLAAKDVKPYLANAEKKTRATFDVVDEAEGAVIYAQGVNAHASTPYEGVNALTALNTLLAALPLHGHGAELVRGLSRIFPHGDFYGVGAGVAQEDAVSGKLTITLDMLSMDAHSARAVADCRAALCANDQNLTDVMRAIRLHRLYDGRQQDVSAALCFRGFSSGAHAAEGLRGLHRQARPLHRHRRRHLCPQPGGRRLLRRGL